MTGEHGVLLLAHGARDPQWAAPFEAIARQLRQHAPRLQVMLCFLDLMPPALPEAAAALVAAGCRDITVVPMFLGAGGHVRNDVPALLAQARQRHPQVRFGCTAAIGEADGVVRAIAAATLELVQQQHPPGHPQHR